MATIEELENKLDNKIKDIKEIYDSLYEKYLKESPYKIGDVLIAQNQELFAIVETCNSEGVPLFKFNSILMKDDSLFLEEKIGPTFYHQDELNWYLKIGHCEFDENKVITNLNINYTVK